MTKKLQFEVDLSAIDESLRPAVAEHLKKLVENLAKELAVVQSAEAEQPTLRTMKPNEAAAHLVVHGVAERLSGIARIAGADVVVSPENY